MFAIALRYGAISGAIVVGVIIAGMIYADGIGGGYATSSLWFGYLIMILALSTIFLAIREYRNKTLGGVIKFLPAFGVGLLVASALQRLGDEPGALVQLGSQWPKEKPV